MSSQKRRMRTRKEESENEFVSNYREQKKNYLGSSIMKVTIDYPPPSLSLSHMVQSFFLNVLQVTNPLILRWAKLSTTTT